MEDWDHIKLKIKEKMEQRKKTPLMERVREVLSADDDIRSH